MLSYFRKWDGNETEVTLPAKNMFINDFSSSELSFGTEIKVIARVITLDSIVRMEGKFFEKFLST